jgi:hypothetical protein
MSNENVNLFYLNQNESADLRSDTPSPSTPSDSAIESGSQNNHDEEDTALGATPFDNTMIRSAALGGYLSDLDCYEQEPEDDSLDSDEQAFDDDSETDIDESDLDRDLVDRLDEINEKLDKTSRSVRNSYRFFLSCFTIIVAVASYYSFVNTCEDNNECFNIPHWGPYRTDL